MEFDAVIRQADSCVVVALFGELDATSAPEFNECLTNLGCMDATTVELDVSQLRFVDSAGVAVFRRHRCTFDEKGGSLTVQRADTGGVGIGRLFNEMSIIPTAG